jgi:hypothetical protein
MARLTLSDADKQARDWFVNTTESLGCKVKIDAMGMNVHSQKYSGFRNLRCCRQYICHPAGQG